MKLFKVGTILQLIYCFCCLLVVICMPLYTAFYTTTFGEICFRIGAILTFVSTFNPMGLIGTIIKFIACFSTDLKKSKKILNILNLIIMQIQLIKHCGIQLKQY